MHQQFVPALITVLPTLSDHAQHQMRLAMAQLTRAQTYRCFLCRQALPPAAPVDLATVCFAGGSSPDRVAARDALEELAAWAPNRQGPAASNALHST